MVNVREFKRETVQAANVTNSMEFTQLSDEHREFFNKLNDLGSRNIRTQPPEEVPDIDATVELTEAEVAELRQELRTLLGS